MITLRLYHYRLLVVCAFAAMLSSCHDTQTTLEKYQQALRSHRSLSYHTHMKIWSTTQQDTIHEDEEIGLEKLRNDTLMNGRVWISNKYGQKYYDGEAVYFHSKDLDTIEKFLVAEQGISLILGNISGRAVLFDFLDTAGAAYRKCARNVSTINGSAETDSFFVKNEDASASVVVYTFRNGGPMPVKISWTKNINNVEVHRELTFSEINFDQDIARLWSQHTDQKLPIVIRHPAPAPQPLAVGAAPGGIDGVNAESGLKESTPSGKIVVLDFWFIGCRPCMDAIPHVAALRKKYPKDKVAVIGINVSDTQREGVKTFMEKNGINYTVLLASPDLMTRYAIHAFPTFYVLDRSGKVIFSEMGYVEEGFEERVSKVVDSQL